MATCTEPSPEPVEGKSKYAVSGFLGLKLFEMG